MIRILGCRLDDEGSITIEWLYEHEYTPQVTEIHQTIVTSRGQEDWEHVGYYARELREDLEELVAWTEKYRLGKVPGQ